MKQKCYKSGQLASFNEHIYRICTSPANYECGCDICDLKCRCNIYRADMTKLYSICSQKYDFYFKCIK